VTVAKSPTEQIRDLALEVRALRERDGFHEREIQRIREDLGHERSEREQEREARAALEIEHAALKQQLQDHLKQVELWDNRRWGLFVLLIGTVLSLASGLIVTLARR
jgi:hypothetical protein